MKEVIFYLMIVVFYNFANAKEMSLILRGKITNLETNEPLANTEIRFQGHGTARTDSHGVFTYEIHNDRLSIIELDKIGTFEIVYPKGGIITIPRSPDVEVSIFIGEDQLKKLADKVLTEVGKISDQIDQLSQLKAEYEKYNESNKNSVEQFKLQQIVIAEQQRLIKEKAKVEILPRIASAFDHYLSRMRDLRDELDRKKDQVFNDTGKHIHAVQARMDGYTEAYEELNKQREASLIYIENNWDDKYLVAEVRALYKATLDEFHNSKVLPYNRMMENINRYNDYDKNRLKKPQLLEEINAYIEDLGNQIDILEKDKTRIIQQLKDY